MMGTAETCMVHGGQGPRAVLSTQMWGRLLAADEEGSAWTCSSTCQAPHVYLAWVPQGNAKAGAGWPAGRMGCRSVLAALSQGRETGMQGKSSQHAAPHSLPTRSCPGHQ